MARPKPIFTSLSASRKPPKSPWPTTLPLLALLIIPPTLVARTISPAPLRNLVLAYALAVNLATFWTYRHDKRAAVQGSGRRVRETHLHLWALAGGWLGALVAQRLLRHKTRKKWGFLVVFWVTVVVEQLLCLKMLGLL